MLDSPVWVGLLNRGLSDVPSHSQRASNVRGREGLRVRAFKSNLNALRSAGQTLTKRPTQKLSASDSGDWATWQGVLAFARESKLVEKLMAFQSILTPLGMAGFVLIHSYFHHF